MSRARKHEEKAARLRSKAVRCASLGRRDLEGKWLNLAYRHEHKASYWRNKRPRPFMRGPVVLYCDGYFNLEDLMA